MIETLIPAHWAAYLAIITSMGGLIAGYLIGNACRPCRIQKAKKAIDSLRASK